MRQRRPVCSGPLAWRSRAYDTDIANLKAALSGVQAEEAFLPSASVGMVSMRIANQYYASEEAYLYGLAGLLNDEYRAITDAGLLLQIDAPDLAMSWSHQYWDSIGEFRMAIELRVEALNHALSGVPEDRVRLHICWGNHEGPHNGDVALEDIIDIVFKVKAQCYSIEAANPRHAHEWEMWENLKLPDGKILMPGVIDSVTNFVEHPKLVAQRISSYANLVGRENVIAGTDCGFGTFAGRTPRVHPDIVLAKFRAMAEGTRIATKKLWGRN